MNVKIFIIIIKAVYSLIARVSVDYKTLFHLIHSINIVFIHLLVSRKCKIPLLSPSVIVIHPLPTMRFCKQSTADDLRQKL